MIIFSVLYGITSYSFAHYGEMLTYLGMTAPMATFALVSWLKNPFNGHRSEVKVNRLKTAEIVWMLLLTAVVTVIFGLILNHFNTANIFPSTASVTTSFLSVYLTFRRSAYFALMYAVNDIVLIVLWVMASASDVSYVSVVICFAVFILNDIYGFLSWSKMRKRQEKHSDRA